MRSAHALLMLLLCAAPLHAQAVRSELQQTALRTEQELADLFRQRPEIKADMAALHELRADLRILQRWLCTFPTPAGSELEAAVALRALDLQTLVELADAQTAAPTRPQAEAMTRLRRLTYNLPPKPDGAALDKALAEAAKETAAALGLAAPTPGSCRPTAAAPVAGDTTSAPAGDLAARVRSAAISLDLRRQLLAMVEAARLVADDPEAKDEHAELTSGLDLALRLTDALAANTAVGPADRSAMESRLAEALVLYTDPRTRDAGKSRLSAMEDYRKLVEAIEGLQLTGDAAVQLQPALHHARSQPNQREIILNAIRTYAQAVGRFNQRPKPAADLPAHFQRNAATLSSRFESARRNVLTAAGSLGSGAFATTPAAFLEEARQLETLGELTEAFEQLPLTFERLNRSKPLPALAIEERVRKVAVTAIEGSGAEAAEAQSLLLAMHRVRKAAETLETAMAKPLPPQIDAEYAAGRIATLLRWAPEHVAGVAKAAAEGQPIDPSAISRLQTAAKLIEIGRKLAEKEATLKAVDALQPWGDWRVEAATLRAATAGFRQAYGDALTGVMAGREEALQTFEAADRQYAPLLNHLAAMAVHVDACRAMPADPQASIDRLATPSNVKVFAIERKLSLLLRELAAEVETPAKREARLKQITTLLAS